jgi:hypothetical protein
MPSVAELLDEAERRPIEGWDLTYDGRITSAAPWDFEAMADAWIGASPDLLDMGTGGGEWLSRRAFPKDRTVAIEGWAPNVPVARARLWPRGIAVVAIEGAPDNTDQPRASSLPALPFVDGAFHRIVNRHESFVAAEVARVLASDGRFLTQQVASDLAAPFRALLGLAPQPPERPWTLAAALNQVETAGLTVTDAGEGAATLTFADVGALAWYLLNVPWVLPDFALASHRARLQALGAETPLHVEQPMFWLSAHRPS